MFPSIESTPVTIISRPDEAPNGALRSWAVDDTSGKSAQDQDAYRSYLDALLGVSASSAGLILACSPDGQTWERLAASHIKSETSAQQIFSALLCDVCGSRFASDEPAWVARPEQCLGKCMVGACCQVMNHCREMLIVPLRSQQQVMGCCLLGFEHKVAIPAAIMTLVQSVGQMIGHHLLAQRQSRQEQRDQILGERRFLANEVHDSVAQSLVYMNLRMPLLRAALEKQNLSQAGRYLDDVEDTLQSAQTAVRELMTDFRVSMNPQGLRHALNDLVQAFKRQSSTQLDYQDGLGNLSLTAEQERQLFHIVQEALANIRRHANAGHAWVRLDHVNGQLVLDVQDDGKGFGHGKPELQPGHYGVGIMRERANSLGACLSIGPREGGGTVLTLKWSVPDHGKAQLSRGTL